MTFCLVGALALPLTLLGAAEAPIPPDLQAAILVRALAYDRALKGRAGSELVVGVIARAGDKASLDAQQQVLKALATVEPHTVAGMALHAQPVILKERSALGTWASQQGADALYVSAGLSEEDVEAVRSVCAELKLVSFGANRTMVEKGLAVAVVAKGDTPRLLVNLKSAIAAGMDLDPKLLQLSEVLR